MTAAAPRRGRPRDESIDAAVLAATLEELRAHGFAGLSIEAVAARAGVAKTTVYRRWSSSEDLAVEAMRSLTVDDGVPPEGDGRTQVVWLVHRMRRLWNDPTYAAVMRRVAADGTAHPEIYRAARQKLIGPAVERLDAALRRCRDEGTLRADVDLDLARRMIVSPIIASAMTLRPRVTRAEAETVVETVLRGLAP